MMLDELWQASNSGTLMLCMLMHTLILDDFP